jgi:UDP-N-acetyl-D-mannosaminuronate dehydrogenase
MHDGVDISSDLPNTLKDADCVILMTDHNLYKMLDPKQIRKMLKTPAIFIDGRNMFKRELMEGEGIRYIGIGR